MITSRGTSFDLLIFYVSGNEIRYPVILTEEEQEISAKIAKAFNLVICGFDLIRASSGKTYVCDVNGFQLSKDVNHFYDYGSLKLGVEILKRTKPEKVDEWTRKR